MSPYAICFSLHTRKLHERERAMHCMLAVFVQHHAQSRGTVNRGFHSFRELFSLTTSMISVLLGPRLRSLICQRSIWRCSSSGQVNAHGHADGRWLGDLMAKNIELLHGPMTSFGNIHPVDG